MTIPIVLAIGVLAVTLGVGLGAIEIQLQRIADALEKRRD